MKIKVVFGLIVLLIVAGLIIWLSDLNPEPADPGIGEMWGETVTLTGIGECLPKKDTSGPITMECAFGIVAQEKHYQLLNIPQEAVGTFETGSEITVEGTLLEPDPNTTYDIVGAIDVTAIRKDTATENTHVLPGGKLAFYSPEDFGLAISPEQILTESVVPPCDEGFDYCIYYNADTYAKTNFESAGVSITERVDLTSAEACLSTEPAGYSGLTPKIEESEGYSTSLFSPIQSAGAGHSSTGSVYRLAFDSKCYEFETRIGLTQFENFEAGTIDRFTDENKMQVETELISVLEGIHFVDGDTVVFPVN